jgi:hypothetical protein
VKMAAAASRSCSVRACNEDLERPKAVQYADGRGTSAHTTIIIRYLISTEPAPRDPAGVAVG